MMVAVLVTAIDSDKCCIKNGKLGQYNNFGTLQAVMSMFMDSHAHETSGEGTARTCSMMGFQVMSSQR